jgi:hypothetical protein
MGNVEPVPPQVRLSFQRLPERRCGVQIRNEQTREILTVVSLREARDWLTMLGFRYIAGTNGVWARA